MSSGAPRAAAIGFLGGILCEQAIARGYSFLATLTIGLLTGMTIGVFAFILDDERKAKP